ncbi:DUF1772 domain-containing protein [Streptomyces sp. NP160]|uniref:DUF1772 domain-containing protein n=1 Tax=Streptomyces sp. NP160 TaxID=2586637 RepID=UPI001119DF09|nr:DUF1772 domain-containing protein [Streptomyces sp. NP160]TNM68589.1 DUF1772 domain-containing protein [Streptomyces sp. NP160]
MSTSAATTSSTAAAAGRPRAARWCSALAVLGAGATGLVAGVHISGIPLAEALRTLDPAGYTTTKQALDVSYPKLMRPLLLATLGVLAASLAAQCLAERRGAALASGVALAAGVVVLVAVLRGDLPINQTMDAWDPLGPPAGWEAVRADWERWFAVRAAAGLASFAAALAALAALVARTRTPSS